jgi:hypothetical protein
MAQWEEIERVDKYVGLDTEFDRHNTVHKKSYQIFAFLVKNSQTVGNFWQPTEW